MRRLLTLLCLLLAGLASAQTKAPAAKEPNAVRLTKYILGVADLDRSYIFYRSLGMDLAPGAELKKPASLADALLKLVTVPPGTRFRNMMLKIPGAAFDLEVTEFSNMELQPGQPHMQDPGASLFSLAVRDIDAAIAAAKNAGGEVVTTGGLPITVELGEVRARMAVVKDPDSYYIELQQVPNAPQEGSNILGARFGSVVEDIAKTVIFYHDNLGFAVGPAATPSAAVNSLLGVPNAQIRVGEIGIPGTKLAWRLIELKGVYRKPYQLRIPDPGAPAIGLEVHDLDDAVAAVKAAGGTSITEGGSVQLGNGKVGFVRDPSGILVELSQR